MTQLNRFSALLLFTSQRLHRITPFTTTFRTLIVPSAVINHRELVFPLSIEKMHELNIDTGNRVGKITVIDAKCPGNPNINLAAAIREKISQKKRFYGIEVSPVQSIEPLDYNAFKYPPMFTSITWLQDINLRVKNLEDAPAVQLTSIIRQSNPAILHLTCYNLDETKLKTILSCGINNVLALKGDLPNVQQPWKYAIDLVRAIRRLKPDATIAVAGYPEVHSDAIDRDTDLKFLKEKCDAGADFILTNLCFSFERLAEFIHRCRTNGINVPIIPGIYVPSSYVSLVQMCRICKVSVPDEQMKNYRKLKNNVEQFQQYAKENTEKMLIQLFDYEFENVYGVHFYTLNKYDNINDILANHRFEN